MTALYNAFNYLSTWIYPLQQQEDHDPSRMYTTTEGSGELSGFYVINERKGSDNFWDVERQAACPKMNEFLLNLSTYFEDLTLEKEAGRGQTSKVWKVSYNDETGIRIPRALRVSRTDSLQADFIKRGYDWSEDSMGYEWHALLDFQSPYVLSTEKVLAWNKTKQCYRILSQEEVMEVYHDRSLLRGTTLTLYATISEYFPRVRTLQDRINDNPHFSLSEIQSLARQILQGLVDIQKVDPNLMHRDIKPANMLLVGGQLKLCDFGFSRVANLSESIVGTPLFIAPEMMKGETHNTKADIYSVFVTLFKMVTKEYPLTAGSQFELMRIHEERTEEFETDKRLDEIDSDLRDLIVQMGRLNPTERLSAQEALDHPFFKKDFV